MQPLMSSTAPDLFHTERKEVVVDSFLFIYVMQFFAQFRG